MAKKYTVFQSLDRAISGNWSSIEQPHVNAYDMRNYGGGGDKVLYKTTNKDDYEQKKLELQQNRYLADRWVKSNVSLALNGVTGLNNIKLMYRDADLMDAYPEIGAALDILSDEACIAKDSTGAVVNVYSKSERVKSILEDLFVNRLNIQLTAQMVIRAMCKYGNQFMLLDIDHKKGVKGWKQLPVFQVERIENGIVNPYGGGGMSAAVNGKNPENVDMSTQFVWVDGNNSQVPFRNWQVAHFRLLSNSIYLPYGCLVGDTRIETEFGYKEMSNICIGDKVWTFNTNSQKRELADVTMFMPKGEKEVYKVSTLHNEIEGTEDHKLLTYEGDNFIYKEIKDIKVGDLVIVDNSNNKCDKKVYINKSYPSEKEANLKKTMSWWKDYIDFIPDFVDEEFAKFFGFMLGDGWITQSKYVYFATGEYDKFNIEFAEYLKKITNHPVSFQKMNNKKDSKYEYSSCLVCSKCLALIMHRMGFIDGFDKKRIPSWLFTCSDAIKKSFLNGLMLADGSYHIDKYNVLRCSLEMANEQLIKDAKTLVQSLGYKSSKISNRNRIGRCGILKNGSNVISKHTTYYFYFYEAHNNQEKKYDLANRLEKGFKTEKVKKIEYVGKKQTYDFTVSNENSNFFANGIVTHNCSYLNAARRHWRALSLMEDMMLIYRLERSIERRVYKIFVGSIDDADVQGYVEQVANELKRTPIVDPLTGQLDLRKNILGVADDLFIPVRTENAPTPIDTLPAGQNMTAIDDIKFMQNKVLAALRIPKSFLNFEETAGDGKNLSLMDIRFTRAINRIQQAFLMELTKVASIHLYLLGFDDELTNFTLTMNNPSTQAEQLEIENMQKKIDAVRDAVADPGNGLPVMSQMRALKEIMKWSEKDIKNNLEEIRLEKAISAELEKTAQIIKKTGLFDTVDRIYGEPGAKYMDDAQGGMPQDGGGIGGGMMGGAPPSGDLGGASTDFGEELDSLGSPNGDDQGDINGQEGSMPTADMSTDEGQPTNNESVSLKKPLLVENKNTFTDTYLKMLSEQNGGKSEVKAPKADIYDSEALLINEEFDKMIGALGKFVEEN